MSQERVSFAAAVMLAAFLGGGAASVLFSEVAGAQPSSDVVTTEQVNLVNRSGQLRGMLSGEDASGRVSIALLDESGRQRAVLAAGRDGAPMLQLYDESETLRLHLTLQDNAPAIVVSDDDGQRAILGTLNGFPALTFADGEELRAELAVGNSGFPRLHMLGPTGQPQLSMAVGDLGEPLVTLRDQAGRSRAAFGLVQDASVINLSDHSAPRIVLGVNTDGRASLGFLDEAGNIEHQIP